VALALLFAGGPVALAALSRTRLAREYAGREAAEALRRELGLIARIDEVDLDTEKLSIVARNIALEHPAHGRFALVSTLRIRPSWWALLRGQVDLHAITIERVTVWLKVRDGVIENIPPLPETSRKQSDTLELPFNWLHIEQARLVVDADPIAQGELRNIEIHLNASNPQAIAVQFYAAGGFVRHERGRDRLAHMDLTAVLAPKSLAIERLRVTTPEAQLDVRDAELALPLGKRYRGRVQLELYVPQLLRWPHGLQLPRLEGTVELGASIEGQGKEASGSAHVVVRRGLVKQFGFGERVELNVRFDPAQVAFQGSAHLIREGGRVDLRGALALRDGMPLSLHADVHEVSFAKLMEQLGVSPNAIIDWTLHGGFDLSGTTSPLALSGPLRMPTRDFKVLRHAWHAPPPERRILGVESAKLVGTAAVRPDGIHLQDIDIELPSSRLNATVLLGFDNDLRVEAHGLDWSLADSSPLIDLPIGGRGGFDLEVTGTFSEPAVRGHMRVADFAFNRFVFGNIESDFEVDPDLMGVTFPKIDATKNASRYSIARGFLDFRNDAFRAGGKIDLERMELADFYRVFNYEGDERYESYQGIARGEVAIDYTLGYPDDSANGTMIADMDLEIPEIDLDGYRFRDGSFTGRFKWLDHALGYKGGELTFERLFLRKGEGSLSLSGRMARNGVLDLVMVGNRIAVRDTEPLHERLPGLTGTLAVTGTIKGTAARMRADLEASAVGLAWHGDALGDARAYVRLTDKDDPWIAEALTWQPGSAPQGQACPHGRSGVARGTWPADPPLRTVDGPEPRLEQPMAWVVCGQALDGQLAVDMAIGRTEVSPLRGRIAFDQLDFGRLLPRGKNRMPLRGQASGVLALHDGAMAQPHTLAGSLVMSELTLGQLDVELKNAGPIDLRFDRGSFAVHNAELVSNSSRLRISGGGSLSGGLGLSVDGNIDLGLLTTVSETVTEASGSVALGFKVSGQLAQPSVYGHALVRGAALRVASFPEAVREVNGKITFSARRVLLEDFSARVAGGRVSWSGAAELEGRGVGSYKLQIEADALALAPRDGVNLKLGGRGELKWEEGDRLPLLTGRLRVDEFVYTRPVKMDRTLGEMYGPERAELAGYDPAADILALDLALEHSKPLLIRNNLIDAELRLENDKLPFRLVGTDQRFGVLGHMSVRKGTVRFRDTAFDIRQGDIHFRDETRIDPNFDLRATTDVRRQNAQHNWHIEIHAFGNRDQFQFELSSDPYLAEDDIALLLTMGMTRSELAQVETGDLTSTAALEALASVTGVEREVHRVVPQIDDLHIASSYSERSNRTEPQLVIGKRIAQNVRLSAATGIAQSRDFSTGVELQLNDKTSVQAVYNNQNTTTASQIGDVGVDLKWRLEFD
jgi:translocation and assembly module TamB